MFVLAWKSICRILANILLRDHFFAKLQIQLLDRHRAVLLRTKQVLGWGSRSWTSPGESLQTPVAGVLPGWTVLNVLNYLILCPTRLWGEEAFADVVIATGDHHQITAHKVILRYLNQLWICKLKVSQFSAAPAVIFSMRSWSPTPISDPSFTLKMWLIGALWNLCLRILYVPLSLCIYI